MPDFSITRERGALDVHCDGVTLARYVFTPVGSAFEGPKPFLHPIRTLSGSVLTGFRPWDHRWHKGLQMTLTDISGQNFWGGNTYVRGQGYQALDNVGTIRHDDFESLGDGARATIDERLTWITATGEHWLDERRTTTLHDADHEAGSWVLDLDTELTNISGHGLTLGSPATNGRENAGYSGLFWRLPRSFTGGRITTPAEPSVDGTRHETRTLAGNEAERLLGSRAPWLAFHGDYDETDQQACVLALLATTNLAPQPRWFIRSVPYPGIASSPTFSESLLLERKQTLKLSHRFVLLDGDADAETLAVLAEKKRLPEPS